MLERQNAKIPNGDVASSTQVVLRQSLSGTLSLRSASGHVPRRWYKRPTKADFFIARPRLFRAQDERYRGARRKAAGKGGDDVRHQ